MTKIARTGRIISASSPSVNPLKAASSKASGRGPIAAPGDAHHHARPLNPAETPPAVEMGPRAGAGAGASGAAEGVGIDS